MATKTTAIHQDAIDAEIARAETLRQIHRATAKRRAMLDEPLGMPQGTVRAAITLIAVIGYMFAMAYAMMHDKFIPESLSSIVITIIAFYFGTRSGGKEVKGNEIEVVGDFRGEVDDIAGAKNVVKR